MPNKKIKILIAEHDKNDLEIIEYELTKGGINFESKSVQNESDYSNALLHFIPDIILSDYSFPTFDGPTAFRIREELTPNTPFIFVSGTIGEEKAVEEIKRGVTDYTSKDTLYTLCNKIERAIKDGKKRVEKEFTDELVIRNEKRFRTLIENGTDMITLTNREGKFIYCSPSITKVFGYSKEEFFHKSVFSFFHPDDLSYLMEKRRSILEIPGSSFSFVYRLAHKNGSWKWCEGTLTNLIEEPSVQGLLANFRDISERKEMENKRVFEESNLNALINNTNDLMWSVDRDFNLITSNIPFDKMTKLNFGRSISKGENVLAVSHTPEMLKHYTQLYERAFAGKTFTEIEHFEIPFEFWTEISYYPIRKGDEVVGTACHSRDITERKTSERNLVKSEERLKEAQTISHISSWEVDLLTNINTWSDEFYSILGVKHEDVIPSPEAFLSFIHPDDLDFTKKAVEETFVTFKTGSFTARIKKKNKIIYSEWKFEFDKNNKPIRLFGILHDITERKLAEEEKEKMISDIIQRSKNLEQFTYIISHNLRAPIVNILGLSNILKTDISGKDKDRTLNYLFSAIEKLDEITKDLNKILQTKSEIAEGKELVDFEGLVNSIKLSLENVIQKEKVRITTDFSAIKKIKVVKSYIYSIFYNLILNSIKYRQVNKEVVINIRTETNKDYIWIIFKDNGLGIDLNEHGDKIFGLYKRFHPHIEGKGLGLFMVRTQVEGLDGKISVKSEPGAGTEFTIELPYEKGESVKIKDL